MEKTAKYPNLAAEIKRQGFTIEQFADNMNVSRGSVSNWIVGNSAPSIETAKAVSKVLGVSMDYLFSTEAITPTA